MLTLFPQIMLHFQSQIHPLHPLVLSTSPAILYFKYHSNFIPKPHKLCLQLETIYFKYHSKSLIYFSHVLFISNIPCLEVFPIKLQISKHTTCNINYVFGLNEKVNVVKFASSPNFQLNHIINKGFSLV